MTGRAVFHVLRLALAALFVWSGATKLLDSRSFARNVGDYGIVWEWAEHPTALGLATAELAAGLGLALDRRWALSAILALLLLFAGVLAYGVWLGLDIECGCFGLGDPQAQGSLSAALARDAGLIALVGLLFFLRRRSTSSVGPSSTS